MFKTPMTKTALVLALLVSASPAFAQTVTPVPTPADPNNAAVTQRDVNQQQRIESGLKDGQLSTGEAARLEKGEAHIDKMESNADKSGSMSAAEKARIEAAQNRESAAIKRDDTNAKVGNPNSVSSQRMQADVQRNVNQEKRIEQGEKTGSLTPKEAGSLERGQAKVDRSEYRAGRNGHVGKGEQAKIQSKENKQSARIYHKKHNASVTQ